MAMRHPEMTRMNLERDTKTLIAGIIYEAILIGFLLALSGAFWVSALGVAFWLILLVGLGIVPWFNRLKKMLKS
jgi:hypothetical protein